MRDSNGGSATFGLLDILQMKIDSRLVVLSACDTSRGRLLPGEGVLGPAQAFLQAGAASVVASYWRIADEATAPFMRTFYRYLARRTSAGGGSLARRRSSNHASQGGPHDWAAFTLFGWPDTRALARAGTIGAVTEISGILGAVYVGRSLSLPTPEEIPMSRVVPVLLFSTALVVMASIQTKSEAQTASGIPDYFFGTWTVDRDCTEAHSGSGRPHLAGLAVSRGPATPRTAATRFQTVDKPGLRWSNGLEEREARIPGRRGDGQRFPADFECVPGEEASSPFLAQSGFAVSARAVTTRTRTGRQGGDPRPEAPSLLIFPRNAKGRGQRGHHADRRGCRREPAARYRRHDRLEN